MPDNGASDGMKTRNQFLTMISVVIAFCTTVSHVDEIIDTGSHCKLHDSCYRLTQNNFMFGESQLLYSKPP